MMVEPVGRVNLIRRLAGVSKDISKELDSIADRAFEVAKHAKELEEQHARPRADAAVQCSLAAAEPAYRLDRSQRLRPFEFQPLSGKNLDGKTWQKIRSVNIDKMIGENDGRLLMDFYGEIANADLEADSGYNLTEANLVKLCQVFQLMLQWQQWNLEQGHHAVHILTEQCSSLQAGITSASCDVRLKDVDQGLVGLGNDFSRIADTDIDAMFKKARAEERAGKHNIPANQQQQKEPHLNSQGPSAASASVTKTQSLSRSGTWLPAAGLEVSVPQQLEQSSSISGFVRHKQQQQQLPSSSSQYASPPQQPQPPMQQPEQPDLQTQQQQVHSSLTHYGSASQPVQYSSRTQQQLPSSLTQYASLPQQSQPQQPVQYDLQTQQQPHGLSRSIGGNQTGSIGGSTWRPAFSPPTSPTAPLSLQSSRSVALRQQPTASYGTNPLPSNTSLAQGGYLGPGAGAGLLGGPPPSPASTQRALGGQAAQMLPLHNPNLPSGLPAGMGPLHRVRGAASGYNIALPGRQ